MQQVTPHPCQRMREFPSIVFLWVLCFGGSTNVLIDLIASFTSGDFYVFLFYYTSRQRLEQHRFYSGFACLSRKACHMVYIVTVMVVY